MCSAWTPPTLQQKQKKLHHNDARNWNTRLLILKATLLQNHSSTQTLTALFSSPCNIPTYGRCTRRPKQPSGPPKKSIYQETSQIGTSSQPPSNTSSPTSWLSSRPQTALSMKTLAETLPQKSHCPKPAVSIAFKSQSKISTAKHTCFSLTRMSRIQARKNTCSVQSKRCPASNARSSGLLNGVMLPLPYLQNAWLRSWLLKASSSWDPFVLFFGSKNEAWCPDSASAMNWLVAMKAYTATLHAFYTPNWSTAFLNHALWTLTAAQTPLKWSSPSTPFLLNCLGWTRLWCATTSNSAPIGFLSPLDANITIKPGILFNGWSW